MKYASSEARKLASKGANSACVEDKVVYGWAIHYFEEDSIEGTLFNADGTEYKPAPKTTPAKVKKSSRRSRNSVNRRSLTLWNRKHPNPKSKTKTVTTRTNSLHRKKSTKFLPKLPKKKKPMQNRESPFPRYGNGIRTCRKIFGLYSRVPLGRLLRSFRGQCRNSFRRTRINPYRQRCRT